MSDFKNPICSKTLNSSFRYVLTLIVDGMRAVKRFNLERSASSVLTTCVRKILESLHFLSNLCTWTSFGRLLPSHLKPKFRNEVPLISIIFDTLGDGELWLVTARKRRLGQGNVFTPVCHSVHRGGVGFPACITGHMTRGFCIGGGREVCIQGVCLHLGRGVCIGEPGGGCIQWGWADCRLWSASRRYTSYWNAFLFRQSLNR